MIELFTVWVKNEPSILIITCMKSWLKLGYTLRLFTEAHLLPFFKSKLGNSVIYVDIDKANTYTKVSKKYPPIFADEFRFGYLAENGGCWIDTDVFLIRPIENAETIISTEPTNQSGHFKSKKLFAPCIGLLKFKPNDPLIVKSYNKMISTKIMPKKISMTSQMDLFKKILKHKDFIHYEQYYSDKYCPIHYSFGKEIFTHPLPITKLKYNVAFPNNLLTNSNIRGIHLCNHHATIRNVDFNNIIKGTLWDKLLSL
jgi:hypothetical protein